MMTRSKGKQCRSWAVQVVHIEDPPVNSAAHLCLLAKKYFTADKSIYTEFRMHKLRNKWMKLQIREHLDELGGLTCAHCHRKGLSPWTADVSMRAVLDHRIEIAANGKWNDPDNFQVLCDRCNGQKNDRFQKLPLSV
jgi:5-methylcytosine-specific restriction endonuclease McrA